MFKQEPRSIYIEVGCMWSYLKYGEEKRLLQILYNLREHECETPGLYTEEIAAVKCQLQKFYAGFRAAVYDPAAIVLCTLRSQLGKLCLISAPKWLPSESLSSTVHSAALATSTDIIVTEFANHYTSLFAATTSAADDAQVTRWVYDYAPF